MPTKETKNYKNSRQNSMKPCSIRALLRRGYAIPVIKSILAWGEKGSKISEKKKLSEGFVN